MKKKKENEREKSPLKLGFKVLKAIRTSILHYTQPDKTKVTG